MYGIRAHVHFQQTLSTATAAAWAPGTNTSIDSHLRRARPASASVVAAGRRHLAAPDPSPDRDEPPPHSALEEELAEEGAGRSAGCPTSGTSEEADRGEGGGHPGGHRRASPWAGHSLVYPAAGSALGPEPRYGHAGLAQGWAAASSAAAVHGQPRSGLRSQGQRHPGLVLAPPRKHSGFLRRREDGDPGSGSHATRPAAAAPPAGKTDGRVCTARNRLAVCRPGGAQWEGGGAVCPAPHERRVC